MRLLHTTHLTFEEFFESEIPEYAILSHRWESGQEISYEDFLFERKPNASGWEKIRWFAGVARDLYHLDWCWVDTCCIDKKSSAELSEAINSMYKWYQRSAICIALLVDVDATSVDQAALEQSQWFKRGWTLQELLAPKEVVFYQGNHQVVGTRSTLRERLAKITGIPGEFLFRSLPVGTTSVAKRMSWASQRQTTRVEDMAYCLLGIFDVNMPLLYGEGEKAFIRLQQEIINQSDDESIFAWTTDTSIYPSDSYLLGANMLADSPRCFANSGSIQRPFNEFVDGCVRRPPYTVTNKGLDIQVLSPVEFGPPGRGAHTYVLIQLDCHWQFPAEDLEHPRWSAKWIYILLIHVQGERWARVALPSHIRGPKWPFVGYKSIRVRGWSGKMMYPLLNARGDSDSGVIDIDDIKYVDLVNLGLATDMKE